MVKEKEKIFTEIEHLEKEMVDALCSLIRCPAVTPRNGGTGEQAKAELIEKILKSLKLPDPEWFFVKDDGAPGGKRPSLIVNYPGVSRERLWIVSHIDVVPEGDRKLWSHDPFEPFVKDGYVHGRGALDNGQALVASIYALYALKKLGISPKREVILCFAADEEMGSHFGFNQMTDRLKKDDLILVPDIGTEKGDILYIGEKGPLWLEFVVHGKQVHASLPNRGINACRVANLLSVELDSAFHKISTDSNDLFDPATSTFEPTRRFGNVANINTVPGMERFAFDCRMLPGSDLDKVIALARQVSEDVAKRTGTTIEVTIANRQDPAALPSLDSPIIRLTSGAVREVLGVEPRFGGHCGATCATPARTAGVTALAWEQALDATAHMPDERCKIEHMLNEAKVFAAMMLNDY
ncbi:MAG: M20 family metallo-hydrolase [Synergistaceae bacterium]|jgi:succinyl-diaminopimelate desuccinylase|nr:M20 family metallo-hydrolase [Synergistaceae bacterium]